MVKLANELLNADMDQEIQTDSTQRRAVKLFSEAYLEGREMCCVRILQKRESDPVVFTTLENGEKIWDFLVKRLGRPNSSGRLLL